MHQQWSYRAGWVIGLIFCLSLECLAQQTEALLTGSVQSKSGSPLADATILLEDLASGIRRTAQMNSEGHYEMQELMPGQYKATVALPGFRTQVQPRVQLARGRNAKADFLLEQDNPGAVEGAPTTARPDNSSSSTMGVIDESLLVGLPMNGRSYSQLATLEAGVSDPSGGGKQGGSGGGLTVSGGRQEWNSFLLDGTDINDTDNQVPRSAAGGQLGADALLQVQIFSVNYSAQYGRAAGGVMNAITRSGTNEWHASIFEFLRNSKVDARNFFDRGLEPPPFKRNQFGGTLIGPLANENTFFMASFEVLRNRLTETYISFVSDNDVRLGSADPRVRPYLLLYPSPDRPIGGGIAENRIAIPLPTNESYLTGRVDRRLGDRDGLFVRYTIDDAHNRIVSSVPAFPRQNESRQQYLTLSETHFFSAANLNTVRLSYTRPVTQAHTSPVREIPRSLFFVPNAPQFGSINVAGLTAFGPSPQTPSAKVLNSFQFSNDAIHSGRAQTLKLGALLEYFQWNVFDSESMGGQWTFSSLGSFLQAGGPEPTTKLTVSLPGSVNDRAYRQALLGVYAQEDLRLRPNLVLNVGLRYEFTTMIRDKRERDVFLVDELRDSKPQLSRFMEKNPSLKNLSPRLGVSWSPGPDPTTVVRAGFGIYYDQIIEYSVDGKRSTIPFLKLSVRPNFDSSVAFPHALVAAGPADQIRIFEYNNPKTPVIYRYNFSLQRELLPGVTAQASYVGARGNHLLGRFEANLLPFPVSQPDGSLFFPPAQGPRNSAFSSVDRTTTDAQSFYNSFFVSLNGRFRGGLSLSGNYTYGRSVDDTSTVSTVYTTYAIDRLQNRGLSQFDVRHRLSLNFFYDLPSGSAYHWLRSKWLSHIIAGWRVGGILNVRTGLPVQAVYNIASPGYLYVSARPNLVSGRNNNPVKGVTAGCPGVQAGLTLGGPDLYFDPCSFSVPPPGYLGNAGRNTLIGPRVVNLDLSLQKDFTLDSKRKLQFRTEIFNLANHPNFREPSDGNVIFRDSGGRFNPGVGKLTATATSARQIQFAIRLSF